MPAFLASCSWRTLAEFSRSFFVITRTASASLRVTGGRAISLWSLSSYWSVRKHYRSGEPHFRGPPEYFFELLRNDRRWQAPQWSSHQNHHGGCPPEAEQQPHQRRKSPQGSSQEQRM